MILWYVVVGLEAAAAALALVQELPRRALALCAGVLLVAIFVSIQPYWPVLVSVVQALGESWWPVPVVVALAGLGGGRDAGG